MDYKKQFLEQCFLGISTIKSGEKAVIKKCINYAFKDMAIGGRYYLGGPLWNEKKNHIILGFIELLENEKFIFSRKLIKDTALLFGKGIITNSNIETTKVYATAFGLAQKLVNMSYKYFYVFESYTNLVIDFSNCDCPLDSIILSKLNWNKSPWTKINESEYEEAQLLIEKKILNNPVEELKSIGRLAFDFLEWSS